MYLYSADDVRPLRVWVCVPAADRRIICSANEARGAMTEPVCSSKQSAFDFSPVLFFIHSVQWKYQLNKIQIEIYMIHSLQNISNGFPIPTRDAFQRAATSVFAHIPICSRSYINLFRRYWKIRSEKMWMAKSARAKSFWHLKLHNDNWTNEKWRESSNLLPELHNSSQFLLSLSI